MLPFGLYLMIYAVCSRPTVSHVFLIGVKLKRFFFSFLVAGKCTQLKTINHLDSMLHLNCDSGRKSRMTTCFRALCCKGPPPARPEYDLVCIGLTGSGKTSLLSKLCSESPENVVSTTGFSIKAVPFQNAVLNVKELGGADNIRKYWSRYYQGSQGVIFVLDSASSEDDLETARNELHSALQHPQLCTLPFLILANHQDKPAARSVQELEETLIQPIRSSDLRKRAPQ
nr:ADP-ribosylation factor-like protein 15 isoform X4 [Rattus norvegicus]